MLEYKVEGEIGLRSVNTEKTERVRGGKKKIRCRNDFKNIDLGQWVTFICFARQNGA